MIDLSDIHLFLYHWGLNLWMSRQLALLPEEGHMNRPPSKFRIAVASCVSTLALGPAQASMPDSGWYWNPAEDGRGFSIEVQDDKIFMSAFAYKPDGTQAWYVAGGPMSSDRTWSADLYETANGQAIGSPYRPPAAIPRGRVSVNFTSERTAQVTLLGTMVNVQRQDWSGYGANHSHALLGEWSTSEGDPSFPVYFSERIILNTKRVDANGPYLGGYRTGTSPSRYPAVGSWNAGKGTFAILLDSSTSYYTLYVFGMNGLNRAEGFSWTFKKEASPTGSGTYFLAHRTKSGARVQGANAPGVAKGAPANDTPAEIDREEVDAMRAAKAASKSSIRSDEDEGFTRLIVDPADVNQFATELKVQMGR